MAQPADRDPDMQAAEYVLGTLAADEAARVERELEHDDDLRHEIAVWEEQLGQLGLALTPVDPPDHVWDAIRARTFEHRQDQLDGADAVDTAPTPKTPRVWQGLAIAASVAALVLAGLLYVATTRPVAVATPTYASIFYDQPTATGWLLTASADTGEMSVQAVGDYPLPAGKELRLWIIPKGGQPIASGIVPAAGTNSWSMSTRVATLLRESTTVVAVSMEAAGQPVSDGPQGPIMWQARITQRG